MGILTRSVLFKVHVQQGSSERRIVPLQGHVLRLEDRRRILRVQPGGLRTLRVSHTSSFSLPFVSAPRRIRSLQTGGGPTLVVSLMSRLLFTWCGGVSIDRNYGNWQYVAGVGNDPRGERSALAFWIGIRIADSPISTYDRV
jgi:hypothetical protein